MSNYVIGYTATNGPGQIHLDGTNERMQTESTATVTASAASARKHGERYTYQTTYDCPPEEQLERYLTATAATRILRTDLETGEQKELFSQSRPYPMVHSIGQIYDGRWLCQVVPPGGDHQALFLTDEDGMHWEALTPPEEAFVYGVCLNTSKNLLACHVASKHHNEAYDYMPTPYSINTIDLRTGKRTLIDSREDTCLFGPVFSPDEKWILYIAGYYDRFSPRSSLPDRHMFDLCIARPDGSEIIDLTDGLAHYNRTSFGPPEHRRRGSNCPIWLDNETVLYSRRSPGAHPDCTFDLSLGDHREDPYDPSMAKGGCQLMKLNIFTREETPLTSFEEGKWDFRPVLSPDKQWIAYISVKSGGHPSELRICKLDGSENRFLTRGLNGLGVDHPVFSEQ